MACYIPEESLREEMMERKKDKDEASHAGDATGCGSDMQRLNISAQGESNVSTPVLSHNTVHGSIHNTSSIHYHGVGTSSLAQPAQEHDTTSVIAEYKESIQSSYEKVKEYNRLPGENVFLSDRYIEPLMVECHRKPKEREDEIRARGEQHQKVMKSAGKNKMTVEQLFRPDVHGRSPKAVILQGSSGYGKSFTAQKIMLDWASGTLFKDAFHLVLHLECKEINEISGECSLVDLLNYSPDFTSDTAEVLRDPKAKLLILVEGFDELKFLLEDDKSPPPKDPFKKAPVQATLKALLKGNILPKCRLLLSTRSTATDKLCRLLTDSQRFVDILGFNEEAVKEYFHRFFCDKRVADAVFERVKNNETLYTACFIPVICWVTCTVFREQVQEGAHITAELETATSIFANFVSTLLKHHSRDLSLPVPALLRSLALLAEKGMREWRVLFSKKDVLNSVSDPERGPFLCKFLVKKKVKQEEMFSFMHLCFQEFFTALHYTLNQNREKLKGLLEYYTQGYWESHRQPVIQFLFGLANTKMIETLDDLQLTPYTSSIRSPLEEWIMEQIQEVKENRDEDDDGRTLFILHCLNELHEEEFVWKAMNECEALHFRNTSLTRMDCWVLRYCLLCCPTIKRLGFESCRVTDEMLRMLQPALSRCEELKLWNCNLTESSCSSLASALSSNSSSLRQLDLSHNSLGDVGVEQLSIGLEHRNCRLETLTLQGCNLADRSCSSLASALRSSSSSLRQLDLTWNDLSDSGVKLLSTVLEHPNCRLETLVLQMCNLPERSCSALASALRSNSSSLRHLHLSGDPKLFFYCCLPLSGNKPLGDSGVELLCTGLEHPNAKLETLTLFMWNLAERSCLSLASALRSNSSSLRHLEMSLNFLGDSGVKLLSTGLEHPNCRLETLKIVACCITEGDCAALASALTSNPSHLTHLNLQDNKIRDFGVKHISYLLRNLDCKIQTLGLHGCSITAEGCAALASALTSNPSSHLTHLILDMNQLGDFGVKHISYLLRNLNCKLQTLGLKYCSITAEGCAALASALTSNPSSHLTHLNLGLNEVGDSGAEHISDLLRHRDCKLELLALDGCGITEKGYDALASALKSNPTSHLKHLNLRENPRMDLTWQGTSIHIQQGLKVVI